MVCLGRPISRIVVGEHMHDGGVSDLEANFFALLLVGRLGANHQEKLAGHTFSPIALHYECGRNPLFFMHRPHKLSGFIGQLDIVVCLPLVEVANLSSPGRLYARTNKELPQPVPSPRTIGQKYYTKDICQHT